MNTVLTVINPANESLIAEIPTDDAEAIAAKVKRARQAQPAWAHTDLSERIKVIQAFSSLLLTHKEDLAATLTAETGKPIEQSRYEIGATTNRIAFFVENVAEVLAPEQVYQDPWQAMPGTAKQTEIFAYDPLGVIVNISAWNYP